MACVVHYMEHETFSVQLFANPRSQIQGLLQTLLIISSSDSACFPHRQVNRVIGTQRRGVTLHVSELDGHRCASKVSATNHHSELYPEWNIRGLISLVR